MFFFLGSEVTVNSLCGNSMTFLFVYLYHSILFTGQNTLYSVRLPRFMSLEISNTSYAFVLSKFSEAKMDFSPRASQKHLNSSYRCNFN